MRGLGRVRGGWEGCEGVGKGVRGLKRVLGVGKGVRGFGKGV